MNSRDQDAWSAADVIFERLLDMSPCDRRQAIEAMALDPTVRAALQRLVIAHETGGFLDRSQSPEPAPDVDALEGRVLGRWRLQREIGRGGMAVVYRAAATDESGQIAALKILTVGAQAVQGIALFRREQTVLARMHHAHIATLFESGAEADGTQWLAMALVDGEPIDAWCARGLLAPGAIVKLFLDVCDAVAHAHRNLVIHRDLKPSNVLVDTDGHVRLLDFGIARLADEPDDGTGSPWRVLTPDYAAPEQFTGASPSTAMDVFGLAALLYKLLTGRSPRGHAGGAQVAITAPSRAMRDARAALDVRRDLDAVLLKALSHEPAHRHASVGALARDLRAWLEQRPVSAQVPSLRYRLTRFVARHRWRVAAAGIIVLSVAAGTAAALWQARRADQQAALAAQHAARAVATRDFLVSLFAGASPEEPGGAVADAKSMVDRGALHAQEEFSDTPALRAEVLRILGALQRRIGTLDDARATLEAAQQAASEAGSAMVPWEAAQLLYDQGVLFAMEGDNDGAESRLEAVLPMLPPVDASHDKELLLRVQTLGELSVVALFREQHAQAHARLDIAESVIARIDSIDHYEVMALQNMRLAVLNSEQRYVEATAAIERMIEVARGTDASRRGNFAQLLSNAAKVTAAAGMPERAAIHAEEAVRLASKHYPDGHLIIADSLLSLGNAYRATGQAARAIDTLTEALRQMDIGGAPDSRIETASILARTLFDAGREAEALAVAQRYESLFPADETPSSGFLLLRELTLRAARVADAELFRVLAAETSQMMTALPETIRTRSAAMRVLRRLGQWRLADGDVDAALALADFSLAPVGADPSLDTLLVRCLRTRALHALQRGEEATAEFERVRAALATSPALAPIESEARLEVARIAHLIGHPARAELLAAARESHARSPLPASWLPELEALISETQ